MTLNTADFLGSSSETLRPGSDEFTLDFLPPRTDSERATLNEFLGFDDEAAWMETGLSDWAIDYLAQRAIPPHMATSRKVYTIASTSVLPVLAKGSWSKAQREHLETDGIEALVIPWFRDGEDEPCSYELKWSEARTVVDEKGKPAGSVKCEFPGGAVDGDEPGDLCIDAMPFTFDDRDAWVKPISGYWHTTETPKLLTEGIFKADAMKAQAELEGMPIQTFAMRGVHQGIHGRKKRSTFAPEPSVALTPLLNSWGPVFIAHDPDSRDNIMVRDALVHTAEVIEQNSWEANRRVFICDVPSPTKDVGGIDDFIAYSREVAEVKRARLRHPHLSKEERAEVKTDLERHEAVLFNLFANALPWQEWERQTRLYEDDDSGRADRVTDELLQRNARHVHGMGLMVWDGKRFVPDQKGSLGMAVARVCADRVISPLGKKETKGSRSFARSGAALERAIKIATLSTLLDAQAAEFDSHAREINTTAGIVNLETGELLPHDPARLHTKMTACGYDPSMPTPVWDRFLDEVFLSDTEKIEFFYQWAGSILVGDPATAERLLIAFGGGENGKSVLFNLLTKMLEDYALTISAAVMGGDDSDHERIKLRGVRFAVLPEPPENWSIDAGALKQTFSKDSMSARALYKDAVNFLPSHTGVIFCNHLPIIKAADDGTWRRLNFLPFDFKVDASRKDENLGSKLAREMDGIMARLVEGAMEYLRSGNLPTCAANETFKDTYRDDADWLGNWMRENCEATPNARIERVDGFRNYQNWLMKNDLSSRVSSSTWARQLQERNLVQRGELRSNGKRFLVGLQLKSGVAKKMEEESVF